MENKFLHSFSDTKEPCRIRCSPLEFVARVRLIVRPTHHAVLAACLFGCLRIAWFFLFCVCMLFPFMLFLYVNNRQPSIFRGNCRWQKNGWEYYVIKCLSEQIGGCTWDSEAKTGKPLCPALLKRRFRLKNLLSFNSSICATNNYYLPQNLQPHTKWKAHFLFREVFR